MIFFVLWRIMDSKPTRAVSVACDMVALNYLRSSGFSSLASEFQISRRIPAKIADSFRFVKIILFICTYLGMVPTAKWMFYFLKAKSSEFWVILEILPIKLSAERISFWFLFC
jgi:hypothetical protein